MHIKVNIDKARDMESHCFLLKCKTQAAHTKCSQRGRVATPSHISAERSQVGLTAGN